MREQSRRRDSGSVVSAVIRVISGGGSGWAAQTRAWERRVVLRPAKAMDLRGEDGEFKNLRASLITYLPVNPEAPRIMRS